MILSVILSIYFITASLEISFLDYLKSEDFNFKNKIFVTENLLEKNHFIKSFIGGVFITICMTGLDQDMMQKNLTCKSLYEAQKNMVVFSLILVLVTFIFLILGALLFTFAEKNEVLIPFLNGRENTDLLFPQIALNSGLDITLSITFMLGLIAAAYSSADSALTSLTTSFCIDFLEIEKKNNKTQKKLRFYTHILMSFILVVVIIVYKNYLSTSVIDSLLVIAGFTYGPLLGLFGFGILTKYKIHDNLSIIVCLISVLIITLIFYMPSEIIGGYIIGYELLPINGLITFIGLYLIRKKETTI
jgi:Na+/proline symporter